MSRIKPLRDRNAWRLYATLTWPEAMFYLRRAVATTPLVCPATEACPGCEGKIRVWHDPQTRGHWATCPSCGITGSPFSWLLAIWRVSPAEAVSKMKRLGALTVPRSVQAAEDYLARTERVLQAEAAYRAGQDLLNYHPDWASKVGSFRQESEIPIASVARWLGGPGRICGFLGHRQLDSLKRTLVGKGPVPAADLRENPRLVVGYEDIPGRLATLWAGTAQRSQVFALYSGYTLAPDAGLAGLATVPHTKQKEVLGKDIFAIADPWTFLRLQAFQAMSSQRLAPVVGFLRTAETQTSRSWSHLPRHRTLYVVDAYWDWDYAAQLAEIGARVTVLRNHSYGLGPVARASADEVGRLLRHYQSRSHSWIEHVRQRIARTPSEVLQRFLTRLSPSRQEELWSQLPITDCRLLQDLLRRPSVPLSYREGSWLIEDRQGHWYGTRGRQPEVLLSDAPFQVDRVWPAPLDQCQGTILYKGETYPFTDKWSVVSKKTKDWLDQTVRAKAQAVPYFRRPLPASLLNISQRLHPPVVLTDAVYGWSDKLQSVELRRWRQVLGHPLPQQRADLLPLAIAGMDDLPMPAGVDPVAIGVLSDGSTEGAVLWSLLIARIARFLQRAVPGSGQPLLLADSPGLASTVTATTRLLGGSVLFTDETLEDPWKARAAVLRGKGDMILAGAELDDISAEQLEAYPVVFAWVLSYVLANWRELGKGGSMVLRIWKLLANKLPALVHRELPKGVRPCLRAAFWPTDVLASFLDLIGYLDHQGESVFPHPDVRRSLLQKSRHNIDGYPCLEIRWGRLNEALVRQGLVPLSPSETTAALYASYFCDQNRPRVKDRVWITPVRAQPLLDAVAACRRLHHDGFDLAHTDSRAIARAVSIGFRGEIARGIRVIGSARNPGQSVATRVRD